MMIWDPYHLSCSEARCVLYIRTLIICTVHKRTHRLEGEGSEMYLLTHVTQAQLCGDNAAECVRLVTTIWDSVKGKNVAESRASQLEGNF